MSRGVSFATGSAWKIYIYPDKDDETEDEFGTFDWDYFIDCLKYALTCKFKSLTPCNKWLGREDHAILENSHAYLGVSEYCGTVCLWCVPKDSDFDGGRDLHEHWCGQIEGTAIKAIDKAFPGQRLISHGHASNGEQFFSRVSKPDGVITSKEGELW